MDLHPTVTGVQDATEADDGLFLERFQTIYEKSLSDLRTFAQRENRPFYHVRELFEEMHCKSLFGLNDAGSSSGQSKGQKHIQNILNHVSKLLESLERVAGLQSFFLIVNPYNPTDEGILGGTAKGRNFWQGQRGCGPAGVQAFRLASSFPQGMGSASGSGNAGATMPSAAQVVAGPSQSTTKPKAAAMSLKAEVYSCMRAAVRAASGVQTAEMKWSNHSQLETYNIRIVGWPEDVPKANPSALSVAHNRLLLEGTTNGTIRFERTDAAAAVYLPPEKPQDVTSLEEDFFMGTIDFSGGDADLSLPANLGSALQTLTTDEGMTTKKRRRDETT